jgi:hypothetical protein
MALSTNLVSYWKLDESSGDAADSVGANTGTNVSVTNDASGKINYCNSFSGSTSFTEFATKLGTVWDNPYTISMWVKPTALDTTNGDTLLWCGDRNQQHIIGSNGKLAITTYDGSAKNVTGNTVLANGNWYHVVFQRTSGTAGKIYVNGVDDTNVTSMTNPANTLTEGFRLASRESNTATNFNGRIDEVGIWSRALTAGEVSQLWNGGAGSQYAFTNVGLALDSTTAANGASTATLTFAHTCSGTNRILFVSATSNSGVTVTGITYAGTAMTEIDSHTDGAGPTTYLYYLIAPAIGANNVVISASGSSALVGSAISYTGAKQSGQPDASGEGSDATTTHYTQALSSVANNCWHILTARTGNGYAWTADSGTVVRIQPESTYLGACGIVDSNTPKTPAGSVTLGVTSTSQLFGGGIMATIAPLSANNSAFFNLF